MHDPFPTPFTDEVLEGVGGQEMYSSTDGFFGYHHIRIAKEDRHKTTFVIEWGCFQYTVMPFGLKNHTYDIFKGCFHFIQIFYSEVPASLYG